MAAPQTQTQASPAPPNKWQCHVCHAGPYLYVNTTRCTNIRSNNLPCNHDFCHAHCKKDNDIPPPLASAQPSSAGLRSASNQGRPSLSRTLLGYSGNKSRPNGTYRGDGGSDRPCSGAPLRKHNLSKSTQTRGFANRDNDARDGSRPSMAGWWRCGTCTQMNNPGLHTGRCWSCGHTGPCPCCTRY